MRDDSPDLAAEYFAALSLAKTPDYQRRLAQLGMNGISRRCCGAAGLAGVHWRRYRRDMDIYEPVSEGADLLAVILPVWNSGLSDLVAWDRRGNRLASRLGIAFALGETAFISGDKAMVFTDPQAWWRACQPPPVCLHPDPNFDADLSVDQWSYSPLGREFFQPPGIVIVDWQSVWHELEHLDRVTADCNDLAARLDKALKPPRQHRPSIGMMVAADDDVRAA
ncbi:MAG: hypothetical protein WC722_05740 [Rhodospirillales bacterium]|jgi:hypothetical protein